VYKVAGAFASSTTGAMNEVCPSGTQPPHPEHPPKFWMQLQPVGDVISLRRILEPAATAMAATRISTATLAELDACLHQMSIASNEELVQPDEEFHHLVATASGNATLASMLNGVSSRTTRVRAWRGVTEAGATERTISEHAAILAALRARDSRLAEAAALVHVSTTETWFRTVLGAQDDTDVALADA
jgi:GntR family transcriptional repressor for pyruvate dehydrogenase complex